MGGIYHRRDDYRSASQIHLILRNGPDCHPLVCYGPRRELLFSAVVRG
jgi:hypothetical protein